MNLRSIPAALCCAGSLFTMACSNSRHNKTAYGAGISPAALKSHLEFLADDALEGRRTGTRGHQLAAKYLAAQFAAAGLKGGMPDGSYYQKVALRRTEVLPEGTSLVLSGAGKTVRLKLGSDFLLTDTHQETKGEFSAPVVFAGYGVSAPDMNYDDYAGLDVKSKIVAVLSWEAPPKLTSSVRGYYFAHETKREIAAAHGAAAILGVQTPEVQRKFPWPFMRRELDIGYNTMKWLDAGGSVHEPGARLAPVPVLDRAAAETFFAGEKYSAAEIFAAAAKGEPPQFVTKKTATVRYQSRHTALESDNVVAVLEGSDPALKKEYVVLSTHIDHLGIGPIVDGDAIYNGALDNASGCAVLLEIARAFAQLPVRPRRSLMFAAVTGEEQLLLGSDYFANRPPVPIGNIVANINIDSSVPIVRSIRDVVVHGSAHSSLGKTAAEAAAEAGFEVSPDPSPDEGTFTRTDHFSFVRQGVPALFLDVGYKSAASGVDAQAVKKKWSVALYHSPKDDTSQQFDYETGAKFARFVGLLGHKVAEDAERPKWIDGDFFAKRFGRQGGK